MYGSMSEPLIDHVNICYMLYYLSYKCSLIYVLPQSVGSV